MDDDKRSLNKSLKSVTNLSKVTDDKNILLKPMIKKKNEGHTDFQVELSQKKSEDSELSGAGNVFNQKKITKHVINSIFKMSEYNDTNDKILNILLEEGIDGLYKLENEIPFAMFKALEMLVKELFISKTKCTANVDHDLRISIKSILVSNNFSDDNDKILDSILKKGINGLYQFKDDIKPRNLKNLVLAIKKLLANRSSSTANVDHDLQSSIKSILISNNFSDDNDKILDSILKKGINGLYEFQDDIKPSDFKILEISINNLLANSTSCTANADNDLQRSIKSILVSNNFNDDNDKLLDSILKKGINGLYEFKDDITPRDFKILEISIKKLLANSSSFLDVDGDKINSQVFSKNFCKENMNKLEKQKEQIKLMPDCLEKHVLKLIHLIQLKVLPNNDTTHFLKEEEEAMSFDCEISSINKLLEIEHTNLENEFNESWLNAKRLIKEGNFDSALNCLQFIFKKIQPFDIREMIFLLKESQKMYGLIKNQDIILLLGMTGSGKTATVHFLSGSKMIICKMETESGRFMDHIAAEEPIQNALLKFVISGRACSETKHLNPIRISSKDIEGNFITLCDSPGFNDTDGPEVDIVNSINITEIISSCKSVRPVILMNYENQGGRSEGIVQMVNMIQGMIMNINEHLAAFTYLFTKYPGTDVYPKLYEIAKQIDRHCHTMPKNDYDSSKLVLNDMLLKTKNDGKPLDIINDKHQDVLRKILNTPSINNPSQVFKYTIVEQSKNALYKQAEYNKSAIECAVLNNNYSLIIYKIDELIFLDHTLRLNDIKRILKDSIKCVRNHMQKCCDETIEKLNSCLDKNNYIKNNDLDDYFSQIEKFKCLNNFKHVQQLENISELSNALFQNLQSKCKEELDKFKSFGRFENEHSKTVFNNLKIISEKCNNDYYIHACQLIHDQVKQIQADFESSLEKNDFHTSAKHLLLFKSIFKKFNSYTSLETLVTTNKTLKDLVTSKLQSLSESCENSFAQKCLTDKDISSIQYCLQNLENAKNEKLLSKFISNEEIVKCYNALLIKIDQFFENLNNEIKNLFKHKKFKEMEEVYKQMQLVRLIRYVEQNSANLYHSTVEKIKTYVQSLVDETKKLLESMSKGIVDYNILLSNLNYLKDAKWLNTNEQENYESVIEDVQSNLTTMAFNLYESIKRTNLNLASYSNLEEVNKVLQQLDVLKNFQSYVPSLQTKRDQAFEHVEKLVEKSLAEIKNMFCLEKHSVKNKKIKLMLLKMECLMMQPKILHLKLSSIEKIDEEIMKITNSIIDISKNIQQLKTQQELYDSILNEVNSKDSKSDKLKKLLMSISFKSVDELHRRYNENKSKISNLEINIDQNQHEKDNLEMIKLQFNEITSKGLTFNEVNEYISKSKHKNIASLKNKTTKLENKIKYAEQNCLEFIFKSIHCITAENGLNYLDFCLSSKFFNNKVTSYKTEAEFFLIKYKEFVISEMNISLKQIQLLTAANSSLIHNIAQNIKFQLDECVAIQNSKLLNNLMQCQSIKKDMTDKLSKYHTSLNQLGDENLKTEIFQAFIEFEEHSENVSYKKFYNDYITKKETELNELEKQILKSIKKYKYNETATKLSEIDEKLLKPKTIDKIKLCLSKSLKNVINTTESYLKSLGNNLDDNEIKNIAKQLLKLNNAKMYLYNDHLLQEKFKSYSYIDQTTHSNLVDSFKFIKNKIHEKIKKYMEDINSYIIHNDFYEAELKIERLKSICILLENYFNIDEINAIIQAKHINIINKLNLVTEKYENMQMNDFLENFPKQLIKNLDKLVKQKKNQKYDESLIKIKKAISGKVIQALCKVKEVKLGERSVMMCSIKSILDVMPTEIKTPLYPEWQIVKKGIKEEREQFENEFNRIKNTFDVNLINQFMEKCKHNNMNNFISKIQSTAITQFYECNQNLSKHLEENDVSKGLQVFSECLKYMHIFGNNLGELNSTFSIMECSLKNKFENICLTLSDLLSNCEVDYTITCFNNLNLFTDFNTKYSALTNSFQSMSSLKNMISYVENGQVRSYKNIAEFFIQNQLNCENSLKELNIKKINESMAVSKKWNNLLISAKKYCGKNSETAVIREFLLKIESCILYNKKVETLSTVLSTYKIEVFNFKPFKGFKMDQERFYKEFVKSVSFLHQSNKLSDHIDCTIFEPKSYENEVFPFLNNYFHKVFEATKNFFSDNNSDKTKHEFDMFRLNLENIKSFETNSKSVAINFNLSTVEQEINEKLQQTLNYYFEMINKNDSDVTRKAKWLIKIKTFAINLPEYTEYINNKLNTFLKEYHTKKKDCKIEFASLAVALEQDSSNVGFNIISEHSIFKGKIISIFNKNTQSHGIDYVLKKLQGDYIDNKSIQQLQRFYDLFYNDYRETVIKCLNQKINGFNELTISIKLDGEKLFQKAFKSKYWKEENKKELCKLVANIFALWTLQNTEYYNEMNDQNERDSYLMTPHPSQVISVFCILGLDIIENTHTNNKLFQNNLVQVGTGEGKSLILAVVSSVLSLIGFDVSCACYSNYLSFRDYESFSKLFSSLNLTRHVKYTTFKSICNDIMNENFNIRTRFSNLVLNKENVDSGFKKIKVRPNILLIDEVDVFFKKTFYGKLYNPVAIFEHPSINDLTNYIWLEKNNELTLNQVMLTPEYQACCKYFEGWEFIVKKAVKQMLHDVKNFQHEYIIKNDKLAYLQHDSICFSTYKGYKTLFAYYFEHENGRISTLSLNQSAYIVVNCGTFSYAEIPFEFYSIMGVTATLKSLSQAESDIIKSYGIKKFTYTPSIFGENKLCFDKKFDIIIENDNDYFVKLNQHIVHSMGTLKENKRPVLVFFKTKSTLMEFYDWSELSINKDDIQIITEEVSEIPCERDMLIKRATISGQITFLTRVFGRGTDFVCSDKKVISNLGVHVVQTFFSKELSEEVQIQGRTARQGKDGSYSMVLRESDLKYYLGDDYSSITRSQENTIYECLNLKRNEFFDSTYQNITTEVNEAKKAHKTGEEFVENLKNFKIKEIKDFLMRKV